MLEDDDEDKEKDSHDVQDLEMLDESEVCSGISGSNPISIRCSFKTNWPGYLVYM